LTVDRIHVVLYLGIIAVGAGGAYGYHLRAVDVAEAKSKIAAQAQIIDAAEKREAAREAEFKQQVSDLLKLKSTPATTPQQIVERIPQYFPQLQPSLQQPTNPQTGQPDTTKPPAILFDAPQAKILNDTLNDCAVCKITVPKLQADLTDSKTKLAAMTDERDTWKTAAKGGSVWQRTKRALKWIGIGGLIGGGIVAAAKR
jgi:hypothetical protein